MERLILSEYQGAVCTLSLNRPDTLNAISYEMFQQLRSEIELIIERKSEVLCVILKGNGKAFSAGHDLKAIGGDDSAALEHSDYEAATLEALSSLPMPVIAQVHRYCFTGALEMALAADLIFVSADVVIADTHAEWGLSPVWGMTQRLPRRIGLSAAKDLMFSCRKVGAEEALNMGLADRVFSVDELSQKTFEYAEQVANNSPHSIAVIKGIVSATDGLRIHDGLDYEYSNSPGACDDMNQRVSKFINK